MDLGTLAALGGVAFCAGFFDAIAGGGGLITLPALMVAGVGPANAIATNKLQAAAATVSATAAFTRKGLIDWKEGRGLMAASFGGGIAGALLVQTIDKAWLQALGTYSRGSRTDHARWAACETRDQARSDEDKA